MRTHYSCAAVLALTLLLALAAPVSAMSLLQAYRAALQNDPVYQVAQYEYEASQYQPALGRAALLPNVALSYADGRNWADVTQTDAAGRAVRSRPDYNSSTAALTLRQPLLNGEGVARYRQGVALGAQSTAQFAGKRQELLLRVAAAYADAQYALDQLVLAEAQRDAFEEQLHVNRRLYEQGEGSRTDALETQARLELARAQAIEAADRSSDAHQVLSAMVGADVGQLVALPERYAVRPMPERYPDWRELALANNAELTAQRQAVEVAGLELARQRAGHLPRLDLVASYGRNKSESITALNQDTSVRSIGVQLTVPLYAGGAVRAASGQAAALQSKVRAELEASTSRVLLELHRQYDLVHSSVARIAALEQAVDAARQQIAATEFSVRGGVRINLDLLNARQQMYAARRDLAKARYDYLLGYLRLRQVAGRLDEADLLAVAEPPGAAQ